MSVFANKKYEEYKSSLREYYTTDLKSVKIVSP